MQKLTALVLLGVCLPLASCEKKPALEYVTLSGTSATADTRMPFSSAIRVNSGTIVFLSGITAAPVPHSHPHVPAEFDHLDFSAAAQAEAVMARMQQTIEAAGGGITDVVRVTKFVVNVAENQDAINEVLNRYWGDAHRPASTTVEIVRLATDPRFVLEIEATAVIPDR